MTLPRITAAQAAKLRQRHGQLVVNEGNGDCFRACMSYLLGVPNSDDLPNDHTLHVMYGWNDLLRPWGVMLEFNAVACWKSGFWIASVPTKNMSPGITHAIVMHDHQVAFDPSPKRRYRRGEHLLGMDVVLGGYSLHVFDPLCLEIGLHLP